MRRRERVEARREEYSPTDASARATRVLVLVRLGTLALGRTRSRSCMNPAADLAGAQLSQLASDWARLRYHCFCVGTASSRRNGQTSRSLGSLPVVALSTI
jgi:hypothetical protein